MKTGPDIAQIANLIGDPGRANMLVALMSGQALTAGELAREAGILLPTASTHLARMEAAKLICRKRQGRHCYFTLSDTDVADVLEALMGVAAKRGLLRTRPGPRDLELRDARICYNHLAGDLGVALYDRLLAGDVITWEGEDLALTDHGRQEMLSLGLDLSSAARAPECKSCLDWSARRPHLAGRLGRAILELVFEKGWAERPDKTRIIRFNSAGEAAFKKSFDLM